MLSEVSVMNARRVCGLHAKKIKVYCSGHPVRGGHVNIIYTSYVPPLRAIVFIKLTTFTSSCPSAVRDIKNRIEGEWNYGFLVTRS